MDLAATQRALSRWLSPEHALQCEHPYVPASQVLCGKLIALAWLVTGHAAFMPDVFLPFARAFEAWPAGWALSLVLRALSVACCALVLLTPFFRAGCAGLALTITLATLASQPYFANNRVFCAAMLCALALSQRGASAWLPRAQAALLYFGAGLDKVLNADWRNGVFLRSFCDELARFGTLWSPAWQIGAPNPCAVMLAHALHALPWLAVVLSYAVIALELGLALAFVRGHITAAYGSIALHTAIFALTGSSFGMFLYAGLASALLVTDWEPRATAETRRDLRVSIRALWYKPAFHYAWLLVLAGPWTRPWLALVVLAAALLTLAASFRPATA